MKRYLSKLTLSLLLLFTVSAVFTSCFRNTPELKYFNFSSEIKGTASIIKELHKSSPADSTVISSYGYLDLLYDAKNCSVCIYDRSADTYWSSLPFYENSYASVISVTLVSQNGRYYLNSQDNAVAFDAYSVKFSGNGLRVTYYMSDSADTVKRGAGNLIVGEAYASVTLDYTLSDGNLLVSVNCDDIFVAPGFVLEKLSVLPYFGALYHYSAVISEQEETDGEEETPENETVEVIVIEKEESRDFLLVPDGPGALIYTDSEAGGDNLFFQMNGNEKTGTCAPASAPFFGIGKKDASFVGIINEGADFAAVRAQKGTSNTDGVNIVYPEFSITPVTLSEDKYYYSEPFAGNITIAYRFLSAPVCSYTDMAAACREELIRSGALKSGTVRENYFPLNVSVISSINGKKNTTVTDFEQIEDLTTVLKGKGVSDINLALYGIFRDGIFQDSDSSLRILFSSGGKRDFKALCEYLGTQNIPLFVGVNLFYSGSQRNASISPNGDYISVYKENPISPLGVLGENKYILRTEKAENNLVRIMTSLKNYDFDGFAVSDSKVGLYAEDVSFSQTVRDSISSLSSKNKVLLSAPSFGVIKVADVITDIPLETAFPENEGYECIPFVPAVLHSVLTYSGEAIRGDGLYTLRLLKCIEYGAAPHVLWVFEENSPYYYEKTITEVSDFCVKVGEDLADLSAQPMESHKKLQDGVYRTGFSGGSVIYVNYNNYSVNIGNISIPPYDYIRIG